MQGERISRQEGLTLFENNDLMAIGALGQDVRQNIHQDKTFYVKNRHVNYSNVCINAYSFCVFKRDSDKSISCRLAKNHVEHFLIITIIYSVFS